MNLEDLKVDLKEHNMIYRGVCHDCGTKVEVTATLREDGAIEVAGDGSVYKIWQGQEDIFFFKCVECHKKDHILSNFRQCEVYSRAVGYLRPVQQWNKGKKAEFAQRKLFKNTEGKQ